MSTIFPKRGRRAVAAPVDSDANTSFVDLTAPPPLEKEKRHHSPFSYLRMRKRSTERDGGKRGLPQEDLTVRLIS